MTKLGDTRIEERKWVAVEGPVRCMCGHDHYGWASGSWSPQWGYCDQCNCRLLRRVSPADQENQK